MKVGRRSFMGLLAAAPVAGPVVAKEAAKKMGLAAGFAAPDGGYDNYSGVDVPCESPMNCDIDWARERLAELMSDDVVRHRKQRARNEARRLDSDLAAMQSLSPAMAYEIQIQRNYDRFLEEEKSRWEREIAEATKRSMGLA